jgi:hypothetical protein
MVEIHRGNRLTLVDKVLAGAALTLLVGAFVWSKAENIMDASRERNSYGEVYKANPTATQPYDRNK